MNNTPNEFEKLIKAILPRLKSYVEESQKGKNDVLHQPLASNLSKSLDLNRWIKEGGLTSLNVDDFLEPYLKFSQHMHSPKYIGHQVSSSHMASGIADFIHGAINNPMAIYEMGPSASVVERTIVNWMLKKAGWFVHDDVSNFESDPLNGSGVLTHGGSMANLTALLAARASISPEAWDYGNPQNLVILGSDVSHYSIARAVSIMGLGKKNFIGIPTTDLEVIRPDKVYQAYKSVKDKGQKVMALVANACATSTGLYDPVEELGQFCEEYKIWFHVDGAHGASALLVEDEHHFMKGLDKADSLIWDMLSPIKI